MDAPVMWGLLALALLGSELLTGTFYLLMLALGALAGSLSALVGTPVWAQWILAALIALAGSLVLRLTRAGSPVGAPPGRNPDVLADIGARVDVREWLQEGQARVWYRGAMWQGELAAGQSEGPGPWRVVEVIGNRIVLTRDE